MKLADRVKETTTTVGTGSYTLAGAVPGYQSFANALADNDSTYYCVTDEQDWEIGEGTFTAVGTTLSRDTILASSNSNAAVDWAAGTRWVFITLPAPLAAKIATGSMQTQTVSTATTAVAGYHYHVDTASVTVTLPASPANGDSVGISVDDFTDTTVARNGANINGAAEDFIIDLGNTYVEFRYVNATEGWKLVQSSQEGPLSSSFIRVESGSVLPDVAEYNDGDVFFLTS